MNKAAANILHIAAGDGKLEMMKCLIDEKGMNVNARTAKGNNILHIAVWSGRLDVVKYLIDEKGMDVNVRGPNGEDVLNIAVLNAELDVVIYLESLCRPVSAPGSSSSSAGPIRSSSSSSTLISTTVDYFQGDRFKYFSSAGPIRSSSSSSTSSTLITTTVGYLQGDRVKYFSLNSKHPIIGSPESLCRPVSAPGSSSSSAGPIGSSSSSSPLISNKDVFVETMSRLNPDGKCALKELVLSLKGAYKAENNLANVLKDLLGKGNKRDFEKMMGG